MVDQVSLHKNTQGNFKVSRLKTVDGLMTQNGYTRSGMLMKTKLVSSSAKAFKILQIWTQLNWMCIILSKKFKVFGWKTKWSIFVEYKKSIHFPDEIGQHSPLRVSPISFPNNKKKEVHNFNVFTLHIDSLNLGLKIVVNYITLVCSFP